MATGSYKYKGFIERGLVALNDRDLDTLLAPADFSPNFTKYVYPKSMSVAPQTREQWYEDLTSGFGGQNYKQRRASIQHYWEDVQNRSAIAWCTENGVSADGEKYEMDYIMRYEFDEDGKLEKLFEYTDSDVRKGNYMRWVEMQEKRKENGIEKEDNDTDKKKSNPRRRFYFLTQPRSASNLLVRILGFQDQPNVKVGRHGMGYFFIRGFLLGNELHTWSKNVEQWTQDERNQMMQCYQDCFNEFEEYVEKAEAEGKILFVKEHAALLTEPTAQARHLFGQDSVKEAPWIVQVPSTYAPEPTRSSLNETLLPDEFLQTWLPIFLIRHPALTFPSFYRAHVDLWAAESTTTKLEEISVFQTLHWTRTLYDWYTQHLSKSESASGSDESEGDVTWPIVIDADDIMTGPEVVTRLCEIVGLDPTKLRFTWNPATNEELKGAPSDMVKRMLSTLTASAGVVQGKTAANLDLDTEAKKWREEFGEVEGEKMESWVRAAMPDYEYLKAKRLRPKTA